MTEKEALLNRLRTVIKEKVIAHKKDETLVGKGGGELAWLFDFRRIILTTEHLNDFADLFWEHFENSYPFQVGGLEVASIPLISAIVTKGKERGKPVHGFFIRKSRKKDGLQKFIEGEMDNSPIILVDDIINSGASFLKQIETLKAEAPKHRVRDIFTIVRYREKTEYPFLSNNTIELHSLFLLSEFGVENASSETNPKLQQWNVRWYFQSEGANNFHVLPKSTPVLDKERIYFGSDSGNLWALDREDGSVAWQYKIQGKANGKGIFSASTLFNQTLYFGAYDGNFYAIDTEIGKEKWVATDADWIGSSPTLAKKLSLIFIGLEYSSPNDKGSVAAFDMETGDKKWEYFTPDFVHGSPLFVEEKNILICGANDGMLYALNPENGTLQWSFKTGGPIKSALTTDKETENIYAPSFDGTLYAIDTTSGKKRWAHDTGIGLYSTPLVQDGIVYFGGLDKEVYALNTKTGELIWSSSTNGRVFSSARIIEDMLAIGSNDGGLYFFDPQNGVLEEKFQVTERITNPPIYDAESGELYILTTANEIYALKRKG